MDARRSQSSVCRDLTQAIRVQGTISLRESLLRPWRHGEPDQRVSARSLRRPHFDRDDAGQPIAVMVCVDGLHPALRPASHRTPSHPLRQGDLWYNSSQASQAWSRRWRQRPSDQIYDGSSLSIGGCLGACSLASHGCSKRPRSARLTRGAAPRNARGITPGPPDQSETSHHMRKKSCCSCRVTPQLRSPAKRAGHADGLWIVSMRNAR